MSATEVLTAHVMATLLGWKVKVEGSNALPFDVMFIALGVCFDLCRCGEGITVVSNKPGRIDSVQAEMAEILKCRVMSAAQAASLWGKLLFANAQCFGRDGAFSLHWLGRHANDGG